MSVPMALDPSRGFVALPLDVLEIEMSPGAFRTLVEFCRMADAEGVCWPSLDQLGARLSRSRAAISGYVRELRELSLIETETQRTANGFNYRLRFRVTFWRDWKARFRRPASAVDRPAPERGVHPTERQGKKNQIHKNHPAAQRAAAPQILSDLHRAWLSHIGGAPYPAFTTPPPPDLIARTRETAPAPPIISAEIKPSLAAFFAERGIPLPPEDAADLARIADRIAIIPEAPALLRQALGATWKPHWSLPPSPKFVEELVDRIAREHPAPLIARLVSGHLRRWEIHRKTLLRTA